MPIHHPLPTLSKHTLEAGDAPFLGALLLVGDSVFGLEMEPRCAGACVLCCVLAPRALWATSTCLATSWSAATTNNDVIATTNHDLIATTNNDVIATALLWFCACS